MTIGYSDTFVTVTEVLCNGLTVDLDLGRRLGGAGAVLRDADVLVIVLGAGVLDDEHSLQELIKFEVRVIFKAILLFLSKT